MHSIHQSIVHTPKCRICSTAINSIETLLKTNTSSIVICFQDETMSVSWQMARIDNLYLITASSSIDEILPQRISQDPYCTWINFWNRDSIFTLQVLAVPVLEWRKGCLRIRRWIWGHLSARFMNGRSKGSDTYGGCCKLLQCQYADGALSGRANWKQQEQTMFSLFLVSVGIVFLQPISHVAMSLHVDFNAVAS